MSAQPMLRAYTPQDQPQLLELLRLNTPRFFHPEEAKDLVDYLQHHAQHYFVLEENGAILGAGGYNPGFDEGKTTRLSWDIIHPAAHGKGFGSQLIRYRMEQIKADPYVERIEVRTTQLVYPFYQKFGFELIKTEQDYWAECFDLYHMKLRIK